MASPSGMTRIAGPGNTIIATPISSTVKPITATTARRAHAKVFIASSQITIDRKSHINWLQYPFPATTDQSCGLWQPNRFPDSL